MSAYVDKLRSVSVSRSWRWPQAAHLLADSVDELHAFAKKIGLRRQWFQDGSSPHYDLNPARHAAALAAGAKLVEREELVAIIRRLRADHGNKPVIVIRRLRSGGPLRRGDGS